MSKYSVLQINDYLFVIEGKNLVTHEMFKLPDLFHTRQEAQDFCEKLNRQNQEDENFYNGQEA